MFHRPSDVSNRSSSPHAQVDASAEAILRNAAAMGSMSTIHGTSSDDLLDFTKAHLVDPSEVLHVSFASDETRLRRVSTNRLDGMCVR